MKTKHVQTILVISVLFNALMLWLTRVEFLPSMSAFAGAYNQIWYLAMHYSMAFIFFLDGATSKRWLSTLIGFGPLFILGFDMYEYSTAHNWSTGITVVLAVYSIIFQNDKKERPYSILLGVLAGGIFLVGFLVESMHLFLAEAIAELAIGAGVLRRSYNEGKD